MQSEKKGKTGGVLIFLFLAAVFFISFSVAAYIYINSENLILEPGLEDIKTLSKLLGEKENRITELEEELERYKTLYEEALKRSETVFAPENFY